MPVPSQGPSGIPVPVRWTDDGSAVRLLDQTLLPEQERYLRLETVDQVAEAIAVLRVRGAPAIGIAAAMGLVVGARRRLKACGEEGGRIELVRGVREDARALAATRPTAVNLAWALDRLLAVIDARPEADPDDLVEAMAHEARAIADEDREMCRRIGAHGVEVLPEDGCGVLTHCNAGALATGGQGTALAPVYEAHGRGIPVRLYADETRPLLQGARLTAWEARKAGVDVTVVTDSMAAVLMREGKVNLVIVGADRVAANGDVANKIGTYGVAVLARHHGIPFFVALPRSTFDPAVSGGGGIPIEERGRSEVARAGGHVVVPVDVPVWNPAFDVTPAHFVTAFITDVGILRPPFGPAIRDCLEEPSLQLDPRSAPPEEAS
jgi:methylthioribose-1-phosphate isomerase